MFIGRVLASGARVLDGRPGPVNRQTCLRAAVASLKYEAVYLHDIADGLEAERA